VHLGRLVAYYETKYIMKDLGILLFQIPFIWKTDESQKQEFSGQRFPDAARRKPLPSRATLSCIGLELAGVGRFWDAPLPKSLNSLRAPRRLLRHSIDFRHSPSLGGVGESV
jgi:hypothetical protein